MSIVDCQPHNDRLDDEVHLLGDLHFLDLGLCVFLVDCARSLSQLVVVVDSRQSTSNQPCAPEPVCKGLDILGLGIFLDPHGVQHCHHVEHHVARIAYLSEDLKVLRNFVAVAGFHGSIVDFGTRTQMFNELANPEDLSCEGELVLQGHPWLNRTGRIVGAVEIPGIESRKVLDGTEDFVSTD